MICQIFIELTEFLVSKYSWSSGNLHSWFKLKIGTKSRMLLCLWSCAEFLPVSKWSDGAGLISSWAFLICYHQSERYFQTWISCRSLSWTENKCAMQATVKGYCHWAPSLPTVAFLGFAGSLLLWGLLGVLATKKSGRLVPAPSLAHGDGAVHASVLRGSTPSSGLMQLCLMSTGAGTLR